MKILIVARGTWSWEKGKNDKDLRIDTYKRNADCGVTEKMSLNEDEWKSRTHIVNPNRRDKALMMRRFPKYHTIETL